MKRFMIALLLLISFGATAFAAEGAVSEGVVVQANGRDAADFKRALILASNMHEVLTKAKFEIVVYGPSVKLLGVFSDEQPLIQKVQGEGIKIIACGRSLISEQLQEGDMAPGISVVPYGAVHIVNREKEGWQYIRP